MLFLGDSFVAGVGDPRGQGWVGRVAAAFAAVGGTARAHRGAVGGARTLCADRGVPFSPLAQALAESPAWLEEAAAGDGAHPAGA